ncbi:MFS general substrate transporter [Coniophora puteana RWD-64-598 SS2]|uniref:MFS general substrate transporter n=1 Tax=Coniophora puteana (strain RWD-64-598) TaxID=741705 RepID=A0A5M3MRC8_CONPW|nr:MFS general substrate transporter [Coniophora puteana RWD-64-598 SS2]EIW81718.1 MFS general substrate transporter [Coniophora puteana RWD-64-598 SS2]
MAEPHSPANGVETVHLPSASFPSTASTEKVQEEQETDVLDPEVDANGQYLTGLRLAFTFVGLLLSPLIGTLDLTIVSTALPTILSEFDGLGQVTWVPTAYLLTVTAFTLPVGQLLSLYPTKPVYITSIIIFELGSLLCAVSTSMRFLIAGRAIAGIGNAAMVTCVVSAIAQIAKLETRPALFGLIGVAWAIASVMGPLVGGAFTARVTWRWCFYINLPIGGVSLLISWFMPYGKTLTKSKPSDTKSVLRRIAEVDWVGVLISVCTVVAFLFPLQLGGNTDPWGSAQVIVPLVLSAVGLALFIWWQRYVGDHALLPWKVMRQPVVASCFIAFCNFYGIMVGIYYIPLWYQSQGRTAIQSGIDLLPFILSSVLSSMVAGFLANGTGKYWILMVVCPLLSSIGFGLMYTVDVGSIEGKLIGYQIISGIGVGSTLQMPELSIQAELVHEEELIPQAVALSALFEGLGGIVGLAIGGAIFLNQLTHNLHNYAPLLPASVASSVQQSIAYIFTLPIGERGAVVQAYVNSLDQVFLIGVPIGAISSLISLTCIKNYNLKTRSATATKKEEGKQAETP